ncbi:AlkA N-terminal domain-containing protein [Amycolatopsis rhabdoformis]|uniref:AlkA N-terminal domain-containing protein n=1 Tax=Amycolatopsis rhabdoformis TaxID=1448059 RepID=A0ABZ1HXY6_9PSEU|nr:AlkA N-terminal domain-containing protein [Amycolatopsis rhabdoformis]WSE27014.1 AlkA N-terminal domain-containing protein [Amycolatopsis rhabdoformis]
MATQTAPLWRDTERCYRAVTARDQRFDGQFIMAVRTTGIYCRPSCPAITPKAQNVRFFPTSAAAQAGGFRACRRCLPDAVPGSPDWNVRADLAARAMRLISDGLVEREGVPGLARRLGYSERQLGRVLTTELGAGPLALARAHRAHSARLLIELSALPLTDVAFAAGFSSVRQFNETIREVFATTPSQLRAASLRRGRRTEPTSSTRLSLRLPFRAPFDAQSVLRYHASRALPGVEAVEESAEGITGYGRTLRLSHGPGLVWLSPQADHVRCDLALTDLRDLGSAVSRVRRLLDLDADPEAVARVLGADPALAPLVTKLPGVRVPGAVDGPELVLRTVLGPDAARVAALGPRVPAGEPPMDTLTTLFPTPEAVAALDVTPLAKTVATALTDGTLDPHVGRDPTELRAELAALGLDADYVLTRVLGAPDVLLTTDSAVQRSATALGLNLADAARGWRPWGSYATRYLQIFDPEETLS